MADRKLAFALGGGGARGALQVGAIRALIEAGLRPDLMIGTSAGAINAAYLAVHGGTASALNGLEQAWRDAAAADLLPNSLFRLTARMLFKSRLLHTDDRRREFFLAHGLRPDLRFRDLRGPRLILVAANITRGQVMLYGADPDHSVLEGLLASTAVAPWVDPLRTGSDTLVDGGIVSNLPIEPALAQGATAIIAFDVSDPAPSGTGQWWFQWLSTVEQRQAQLERALAEARGVPVYHLHLRTSPTVPFYDFSRTDELLAEGYRLGKQALDEHPDLLELRGDIWSRVARRARRWFGRRRKEQP